MSPDPRRLVLHTGPHKTASSYIQENLWRGRGRLEGLGWLYPEAGTEGRSGHHDLAHMPDQYLPPEAPRHAELVELAEKARDRGLNIVLSAEGFCRWPAQQFDRLANLLGFENYELIYVVRDPLDLFPSLWAEEVKQGRWMGFADRFVRECGNPNKSRILNQMLDLAPLLARKKAWVHAVPYDILKRREIDIFRHIAEGILGLEGVDPVHDKPVNTKYPIELTEFLRLMTLVHGGGQTTIGPDLRLRFTARIAPAEQRALAALVREHARPARQVVTVHGETVLLTQLENRLKKRLADNWSLPVAEDTPLFSSEPRRYVYYDTYLLATCAPVREAVDDVLRRLEMAEAGG